MERESGRESGRESAGSGSVDEEVRTEPLRKDTPGPMPQYQYSREKLQEIQELAESKKRPSYLLPLYDNADGIWDPEKWCKSFNPEGREGSPITLGEIRERKRPLELDRDLLRRKPPVDPKERLKEQQDDIVLSPQRRSFGTGCHVIQTSSLARQSSTTSDYNDDRDRGDRRERRIGSGRIAIDRDQGRDYRGRYERDDRDRNDDRDRHDDRGDRRFDRNDRFRRDYDDRRDFRDSRDIRDRGERDNRVERGDRGERDLRDARDRDPRGMRGRDPRDREYSRDNHRYSSGRRNHHQEEEPEWFTAGPTSMSDTIELQGFNKDGESKENQEPAAKRERTSAAAKMEDRHKQREKQKEKEFEKEKEKSREKDREKDREMEREKEKANGTNFGDRNGSLETNESSSPEAAETRPSPTSASIFDFNQFFHVGSIPGLHDDHEVNEGDTGSRFSRWFAQATGSKENSRRSSINEEYQFEYLNDILKESRSPVPIIPSPTPPPIPNVFDKAPMFHNFSNPDDKSASLETVLHHKNMAAMNPNINHMFLGNTPNVDKTNASISNHQGIFSPQDAEAHLKAMLFGRRKDSASSSGTASPAGSARLKTVTELEAGFHQNSPGSSARMSPIPNQQQQQKNDEGDLTAFNKLLSLMTAGAASGSPEPSNNPQMMQHGEPRQMSPLTSQPGLPPGVNMPMNSKFMEAVMRNREQQMHLQQQAFSQMRLQQHQQQASPHPQSVQQQQQHMLPPQQQQQPNPQQQMTGTARPMAPDRLLTNFLQQNPTIITKPPSPAQIPSIVHNTSTPRIGQSPTPMLANNLLQKQHQQPSATRIPSPIMFSQQPPMHLNAPSPIHPSQLGRAMPNNTLSTSPTMLNRVPSPQELIAHNQAILQSALIKKQLEDQKERFLKKQQDRAKSPGLPQGTNRAMSTQPMMTTTSGSVQSSNNKTTMSPAFTPTSVMRKMHSDKASEKEKGKPEGEEILNKPPIKQLIPDGQGDHQDKVPNDNNIDSNGQVNQILSQELNKLQLGEHNQTNKTMRAVVGSSQIQSMSSTPQSSQGRPIFKSFSASQQQTTVTHMATSTPLAQVRPVTGSAITATPSHRPITGGGGANTLPQPQVKPNISTPLPRPGLPSTPQYGIPITGRVPMQSNMMGGQVHPATANALLVQQMIQNNTSAAARVNVMNQLNQLNPLNQLAAIQAQQQRMIDPRLQGMRGVYPPTLPPMLSPRSNATTPVGVVSPTNTGLGRAVSPAKVLPFAPKQNGPLSPNMGNVLHQNNSPEGNIFNKLFGSNMLKSQLPTMPPLPVQGQRVMTVDELERN